MSHYLTLVTIRIRDRDVKHLLTDRRLGVRFSGFGFNVVKRTDGFTATLKKRRTPASVRVALPR